jgi:tetratricopeptide (TPR) repeat protein
MIGSRGTLFLTLLWPCVLLAAAEAPALEYEPGPSVNSAAVAEALTKLNLMGNEIVVDRYPYPYLFSTWRPHVKFRWRMARVDISYDGEMEPAAPRSVAYDAMQRIGVVADWGHRGVSMDGQWYLWCRIADSDRRHACARLLADYFYVHKVRWEFIKASDARFEETLEKYRDPASRPAFPEEARRYKVQAEQAVQNKRFVEAVNGYVMAVRTAPWWSEGYYNLALLNGELEQQEEAVRMMKRFIVLEPQSPLARAAQDQVYRWEALAEADAQRARGELQRRQ